MSIFTIDEAKCKKDGVCVEECPMRILELKKGAAAPNPIDGAENFCIKCGHCVAVCPHGAFSLSGISAAHYPPVKKDMLLDMEHAEHFLRSRRSIRSYKDTSVENDKIEKLVDVARYAPSAANSQQVKWIVVNSRDKVKDLVKHVLDLLKHMADEKHPLADRYRVPVVLKDWESGIDRITRGAPALVFAHAPKDYMMAQTDSAVALTFLDLAAPTLGLGTCWAGFTMIAASKWPPMQQALSLPEGDTCFGAMMIGYPKHKYHRLPLRNKPDIAWL